MTLFQCVLGALVIECLIVVLVHGKAVLTAHLMFVILIGLACGFTLRQLIDQVSMYKGVIPMVPGWGRRYLLFSISWKIIGLVLFLFLFPIWGPIK